jgi:hypothetical protein
VLHYSEDLIRSYTKKTKQQLVVATNHWHPPLRKQASEREAGSSWFWSEWGVQWEGEKADRLNTALLFPPEKKVSLLRDTQADPTTPLLYFPIN